MRWRVLWLDCLGRLGHSWGQRSVPCSSRRWAGWGRQSTQRQQRVPPKVRIGAFWPVLVESQQVFLPKQYFGYDFRQSILDNAKQLLTIFLLLLSSDGGGTKWILQNIPSTRPIRGSRWMEWKQKVPWEIFTIKRPQTFGRRSLCDVICSRKFLSNPKSRQTFKMGDPRVLNLATTGSVEKRSDPFVYSLVLNRRHALHKSRHGEL